MKGLITIAIVVSFIIILISTSIYNSYNKKKKEILWPPFITKCPDYWELNDTGCNPTKNINKNISTIDNEQWTDTFDNNDIDFKNEFKKKLYDKIEDDPDSLPFIHWDGLLNN